MLREMMSAEAIVHITDGGSHPVWGVQILASYSPTIVTGPQMCRQWSEHHWGPAYQSSYLSIVTRGDVCVGIER